MPTSSADDVFASVLQQGAERMGIRMPGESLDRLVCHFRTLLRWMNRINLTTVRGPEAMAERLYLDSLVPAQWLESGARLHDVGPGAGFPGLVLKAVRPDLCVTLSEARRKKVSFLRQAAREMGLSEGLAIEQRRVVEEEGEPPAQWTETISRATFPPAVWIRVGARMTEPGGRLWVFVGQSHQAGDSEPEEVLDGLRQGLSGSMQIERIHPYRLERARLKRSLVSIRKAT